MEYTGADTVKAKYTYGLGRLSTSNAAASGVRGQVAMASYIPDGSGSVSALMSGTGAALASYSYGPYGEASAYAMNASGAIAYAISESYFGYNGEDYDPMTGLQYLRARYYDSSSGRFGTADTYPGTLLDPLSQNPYSYTQGDPINFSDPSGHGTTTNAVVSSAILTAAKVMSHFLPAPVAYASTISMKATAAVYSAVKAAKSVVHYASATQMAQTYAQAFIAQLKAKSFQFFCSSADRIQITDWKTVGAGSTGLAVNLMLPALVSNLTNIPTILLSKAPAFKGTAGSNDPTLIARFLGISPDPNNSGVYTSSPFAWQQAFGWNKGFEVIHNIFTDQRIQEYRVEYKDADGKAKATDFIMWYGDYLNLGAGAEIAAYTPVLPGINGPGPWFDMGVSLSSSEPGHEGAVFTQDPEFRMWNNGFVPSYQHPDVTTLSATGTIKFKEDERAIYEAFKEQHPEVDASTDLTIRIKLEG